MPGKKLLYALNILLVLQFVLGMLANLYSSIPSHEPYKVFQQLGPIAFHAILGTLLLILGVIFTVKSRKSNVFRPAAGGLISLVLAYAFGELFVFTQHDIFSFLMALSFIGALLSYTKLTFSKLN